MSRMTAWGHILRGRGRPGEPDGSTRAMLEHLGFHVDVVGDGPAAVDAAATRPYRAILLDCQLPVLDGYLAASEIRRWRGASRRTPIIAVTASATDADAHAVPGRRHGRVPGQAAQHRGARRQPRPMGAGRPDRHVVRSDSRRHAAVTDADEPGRSILDAIVERLERLGDATGEDLMGQLTDLFLADADAHVAEIARRASRVNDVGGGAPLRAHAHRRERQPRRARHLAELCCDVRDRRRGRQPDPGRDADRRDRGRARTESAPLSSARTRTP